MKFKCFMVLSVILGFYINNVIPSSREIIRLKITMNFKQNEIMPSEIEISFKYNGTSETLLLTRFTKMDMNVPLFVARNNFEGKQKLIKITQDGGRKSAVYGNTTRKSAFLLKEELDHPENFHVTGIVEMDNEMFELKKCEENKAGKSVKKRKIKTDIFVEITDFYKITILNFKEFHNDFSVPYFNFIANSNSNRIKRGATAGLINFFYDIILIVDNEEYNRAVDWIDPKNALSNISKSTEAKVFLKEFYLLIITCMNLMFQHMEDSVYKIEIRLKELIIFDSQENSDFVSTTQLYSNVTSIDAKTLLENYAIWISEQSFTYDHAMLIVGEDLYSIEKRKNRKIESVTGISYVGTLCTKYSLSIVESKLGFSLIQVMIHEITHSFGSRHDGKDNNCANGTNYIMSQNRELRPKTTDPWHFSKCSIQAINRHLNSVINKGIHCEEQIVEDKKDSSHQLPGQIYSVDQQCKLAYGHKSYFFRHQNFTQDICKVMFCLKPVNGYKRMSVHPLPAAPGTICASNKWCEEGSCVYAEKAPNISEPCLFGDEPRFQCFKMVKSLPQMCGLKRFRETCSCSCSKFKTTDPCRPYGREVYKCKSSFCSQEVYRQGFCCETCPMPNCSKHSISKRSSYFEDAIQRQAKSFLKYYTNLISMKPSKVFNPHVLKEKTLDLASCSPMNADMYEYCNKLIFIKSISACYDELISEICCQACMLVINKKSPGCEYGDRDETTCSQWAKEGLLINQCINNEVHEKICCQSCQLFVSPMFSGSKGYPVTLPYMIVFYAISFSINLFTE